MVTLWLAIKSFANFFIIVTILHIMFRMSYFQREGKN